METQDIEEGMIHQDWTQCLLGVHTHGHKWAVLRLRLGTYQGEWMAVLLVICVVQGKVRFRLDHVQALVRSGPLSCACCGSVRRSTGTMAAHLDRI